MTRFCLIASSFVIGISCSDFVVGSNNGEESFAARVVSVLSGKVISPDFHLLTKLP